MAGHVAAKSLGTGSEAVELVAAELMAAEAVAAEPAAAEPVGVDIGCRTICFASAADEAVGTERGNSTWAEAGRFKIVLARSRSSVDDGTAMFLAEAGVLVMSGDG